MVKEQLTSNSFSEKEEDDQKNCIFTIGHLLTTQQLDDDDGETGKCPRRFSTLNHGGFYPKEIKYLH